MTMVESDMAQSEFHFIRDEEMWVSKLSGKLKFFEKRVEIGVKHANGIRFQLNAAHKRVDKRNSD